jgi:hypothetical protein
MRRKPLNSNPNSMHMIMENFRRFSDIGDISNSEINTSKIYLFENNSKVPTSEKSFADLLEEYNKDIIGEDLLFEQWNKSIDYEYDILITEGIVDIIKKPFKTFANSKVAIDAKSKAREALSTIAAKIFGGAMKIIRALLNKAKGVERGIVSTVSKSSGKKPDEKRIASSYEKLASSIGAGIKKLVGVAKSFIARILKVFAHPLFKAAVVAICIGILLLSLATTTIFVGTMVAAPAYATQKLGRTGALEFWKSIPAPDPSGKAVAEAISSLKINSKTILNEAFDGGEVAQALASILQDIPEGEEVTRSIADASVETRDIAIGAEVGDVGEVGDPPAISMQWAEEADQALNADLDAAMHLQMELAKINETGEGFNWRKFKGVSGLAETKSMQVMEDALKIAKKTCRADPDLCKASEILAQDFEIMKSEGILSEFTDGSRELKLEPGVQRAWSETLSDAENVETRVVKKNPYFDPEEVDPRFDTKPAVKRTMRQYGRTGTGLGPDDPWG